MAHRYCYIVLFLGILVAGGPMVAQEGQDVYGNYYTRKSLIEGQDAEELQFVRESDVVWEYRIWRTIDLREKFNQLFYYPLEPEGSMGRKNLAYVLWEAVKNNEIQIYEDDEFKIPIENDYFVEKYTRADTSMRRYWCRRSLRRKRYTSTGSRRRGISASR